ncbi:hypothetical protein [Acetivibrio thermocellus]|uniref:hypothetical protein n=1 Tax=Acetivibrio thermocellus TaxID=1515 RepID=UPI001F2E8536|nr:hypothetical protein [Acetivibrio thermocellus]UWV46452.1 hypothetical protein N1236_12890 [Acetivibrio thermocellus]
MKIKRIADLIQANMRNVSGNKTFKLSGCSMYMSVESSVSIKYLFASKLFYTKRIQNRRWKRDRVRCCPAKRILTKNSF